VLCRENERQTRRTHVRQARATRPDRYATNYLIDLRHAVVVDVEATSAIRQAEVSKRPADAVIGDRQLSECVLGLAYDRFWVGRGMAASAIYIISSRSMESL
jgi:hypothetical protein